MGRRVSKLLAAVAFVLCMAFWFSCAIVGAEEEKQIVRIGYYQDSEGFQFGGSNDESKTGYAYEYYQELAKYTGWDYEYVYGSWEEIYDKLVGGEVDLMAGVSKLESRESQMLFSNDAMGGETYYIFMKADNNTVFGEDFASLDGKKLGIKSNSYMQQFLEQFEDTYHIKCQSIAYDSLQERVEALEHGELDGIVTVENDSLEGLKPVCKLGSADFYFAVNKDRPDLLEELNEAQKKLLDNDPYYIARLQNRYFNKSITTNALTQKEAEWISAHPSLKVGYLKDYMPFCGETKDGELTGMLLDILNQISMDKELQFLCTGYDSYDNMAGALESGEVDIIFPTFGDMWYSESQNSMQTMPVISAQVCVIYNGEYQPSIYDRIAVCTASPLQPFYLTVNYPQAEQVNYHSWRECLAAVQNGEVGSVLANSNLLYRCLNEYKEFSGLQTAELEGVLGFCFSVRQDDNMLYSVLNTILSNISDVVINDSLVKNSYVEPEYTLQYFILKNLWFSLGVVFAFVLLLILFFALYEYRSKKYQKVLQESYDREKEYANDQKEKYHILSSLGRIYTGIYYLHLEKKYYQKISNLNINPNRIPLDKEASVKTGGWLWQNVKEQYREKLSAFIDLSTLGERMQSVDSLFMEYETEHEYYRVRFISVEREQTGRLRSVIYVIHDITAEKQAQNMAYEALREAFEMAQRANQAKSEFLSRMSHDIRTPMNAITGMTAIAARHIDDKERLKDCLRKIAISGKHLLALINEVLDMSKIESGRLELAKEEFNLLELIDDFLPMIRMQADAKQQNIKLSIQNVKNENVVGDSLHIRQICINLLGNAVKYTPRGGTIRLSVIQKPTDELRFGCYQFVFEDNGIGISKEFLEHIFDPFSREDEAYHNHVQGTGLGLSIVANLVKLMGGDIQVQSEQGKGSVFTVTIYLNLQTNEDVSFQDTITLPVLVVDDSQDSCENICMILDELGIKSEWVLSGVEAVEKVKEAYAKGNYYSVVILDWRMPGMDGLETAKAIREIVGEEIAIFLLSAYNWLEVEDQAREAGVNAFISKPLFKSRLAYLFKQLINGETDELTIPLEKLSEDTYKGKRILLSEDNEINAEIATEILQTVGISVEHAWNGKEALEMLSKAQPGYFDLVFMDIQMPSMNGYETTRAIRSMDREDLKKIPIIAMTANAFAEDVRKAVQSGMNQHIAKPLDVKEVMKVLRRWLG